ncbi:hypothetical protein CBP31_07730 [Oceanisphaera profunda]|uniref:Uncharacterized protein n=1 Tax=Oceanisphaera profunda TaxID=1416627 RepID=A0A1Y0D4Q8_9GAMM|nr:hypothetical protein [Oceanisphaera profunda]ART82523.1 hypothetical protein CBP31_07730 [Oceanisphaera profunda]
MYAYIFKSPRHEASQAPLKINNNRVAFFIEPVLRHATFSQSHCGLHWAITFFKDSKFEQTLGVQFSRELIKTSLPSLARAVWLDNKDNSVNNTPLLEHASRFIRNSDTLEAERITPLTKSRDVLTDRDAVAYFSASEDQFKRIVLQLCLVVAYRQMLQNTMLKLTESVKLRQPVSTLALYEDILHFNAGDYFRYPIKLESHELFPVWEQLALHYKLEAFNEELTVQLASVALLLQEQRENARQEQEKKDAIASAQARQEKIWQTQSMEKSFNRRCAWLGIVLGVLSLFSLLSLVELTPQHFKSFSNNWITSQVNTVSADTQQH